jgi:hypothetical protein
MLLTCIQHVLRYEHPDTLNVLLTGIIVYQYNKTNVIPVLFSLLRIKGLYLFRALLTHPQEVLHKWHLVYRVLCQLAA